MEEFRLDLLLTGVVFALNSGSWSHGMLHMLFSASLLLFPSRGPYTRS